MLSQEKEEDMVQHVLGEEEMLFGVSKLTVQETGFGMASGDKVPLVQLREEESREEVVSKVYGKTSSSDPSKSTRHKCCQSTSYCFWAKRLAEVCVQGFDLVSPNLCG